MKYFNIRKQNQYKNILFSIKLCALFLCAIPVFQHFFINSASQTLFDINLPAMFISLSLLVFIMFIWVIIDSTRSKYQIVLFLEIIMFFLMCTFSIYLSGDHKSYYKFLYIFIIVSYAIEYDMKTGITVALCSSLALFIMDLALFKGADNTVNIYFQSDLALSAMFVFISWIVGFYVKMEDQHIEHLENYANLDGLTGVYNHRHFHEYLENKCQKFTVEGRNDLVLIMIDIDYFKNYNDIFGHQKGDKLLIAMARLFEQTINGKGSLFRYGGDEFCVVLPGCILDKALIIADNLRQSVLDFDYPDKELLHDPLSISMGITQLLDSSDTHLQLIERADNALYKAKYLRRNRVEVYSSIFDQFADLESNIDGQSNSIKLLIDIINSKDCYTYNHIERVVYFCQLFAEYLKLDAVDTKRLVYSAYLHDLGKINISKEILIKDTPLLPEEWEELKNHSKYSTDLIRKIGGLDDVANIVLQHHERYDGKGYPNGVKGTNIYYLARILTLIDSFDAMTSKRFYKESKTFEEAFEEIRRCSGTQFDPELTELFISAIVTGTSYNDIDKKWISIKK